MSTLQEFVRNYVANLPEEKRQDLLKNLAPEPIDKIVQISSYAYVNTDGESISSVYGLSESGFLYSLVQDKWVGVCDSPPDLS